MESRWRRTGLLTAAAAHQPRPRVAMLVKSEPWEPPGAYPRNVMALLSRIISVIVLFAAFAWIALPVAAYASPKVSHGEGETCPCCDAPAALGPIMACPSCQVAAPVNSGLPGPDWTFSLAWTETDTASVTGIDPAPAEPPPR